MSNKNSGYIHRNRQNNYNILKQKEKYLELNVIIDLFCWIFMFLNSKFIRFLYTKIPLWIRYFIAMCLILIAYYYFLSFILFLRFGY
jgi:hypothetical protein